jgi:hypothetical protein
VERFVDPRTAEKLVILTKDEVLPKLSSVIDLENIPEQYGGKFKYEIGMLPSLDEGLRQQLQWNGSPESTLPPGPLKWTTDGEGRRIAVAVGSSKGELRNSKFAVLGARHDSGIPTPSHD